MWLLSLKNILTLLRRWLYVFIILFWTVGVLGGIAIIAYLAFHRVLIPFDSIKIPLNNTLSITSLGDYIPEFQKQPELNYEVSLKIRIHCNRNRNDDIFPIGSTLALDELKMTNQFILNCDSRYIFHQNNKFIPYNLRFWTSPILTDINKSVDLEVVYFRITGSKILKSNKQLSLELNKNNLIIDYDDTYFEFAIQWLGFRYYIVKYPIISFLYGVSVFWSVLVSANLFTALAYIALKYGKSQPKRYDIKQENQGSATNSGNGWFTEEEGFDRIKVKREF